MIAIFDFDYTIFDAQRFKDECLAPFFSMSPDDFSKYYAENFRDQNKNFEPDELLSRNDLSEAQLDEYLSERISSYLFSDTEKVLDVFRERAEKMILASFGNKEWQKKKIGLIKINGMTLGEYFDQVILEDKDKSSNASLAAISGDEILIINDNAAEVERMLEIFHGQAEAYLIDGPYATSYARPMRRYASLLAVGEVVIKKYPKSYE